MLETRARRALAVLILLVVLAGAAFQFGTVGADPRLGAYPGGDTLGADTAQYVGEAVEVDGTVVRTDPVVLSVGYARWDGERYRTGTARYRITGLDRTVRPGQAVEVYGTVQPDGSIRASESVVVPVGNLRYMYLVSFLAGLWVLTRIVRGWTVAWDEFALRRRSRPLRAADVLDRVRTARTEGRTDA
jgi:hypothetical protein